MQNSSIVQHLNIKVFYVEHHIKTNPFVFFGKRNNTNSGK